MKPLLTGIAIVGITLIVLLLGQRLAAPEVSFRPGYDDHRRTLVGFHKLEQNNEGYYVWSKPLAALFAYGFDGRPALAELRLAAPRPVNLPPASVRFAANGSILGETPITSDWRRYHLLLPSNPAGDTSLGLLTTAYSPGEADERELGVVLNEVFIQPVGTVPLLPALPRTLTLLALPLLGWLLIERVAPAGSARVAVATGLAANLVALVGWAVANPSEGSYWLPTLGWPWFPFLPLALLLATPFAGRWWGMARVWAVARPWLPLAGLLLAVLALGSLRLGLNPALTMVFVLIGTAGAVLGLAARPSLDAPTDAPQGRLYEGVWLGAILLVAFGMRFYNLDGQPLGLWRDESRHGLQALQIWQNPSYRPIYVVEGADLPALIFYLMAPVVGLLEPHAWSARLVSALAGSLTPLALWWAARPLIGPRGALCSAALIAWASWSLSLSRWAFPATLDHLLLLTAVGFMWRGLGYIGDGRQEAGRNRLPILLPTASCILYVSLAALCAGLSAYAYHTGRLAPVILAVLTIIRLGPSWQAWRRALPALVAAVVVGLLVLSPLIWYVANDLSGYNRRVGSVSVFNSNELAIRSPAGLLLLNIERYTMMWHIVGEPNGRHHAPFAPMLDPIAGALLLIGLGLALLRWREREHLALLIWVPLGIVPGLFSSEAPHAMRSLGGLAPACILAGMALAELARQAGGRGQEAGGRRQGAGASAPTFVALCLLAGSLAFNTWLYFGSMARNPLVYSEFDVAATMMSRAARMPAESADASIQATTVYLPGGAEKEDTVRFLTSGVPLCTLDDALQTPPGPEALVVLPADVSESVVATTLQVLGPAAQEIATVPRYPTGEPILRAFGVGEGAQRIMEQLR
jgi:4-amino-4-deoxy-L-arabinose transferase-like glycosyltransferase